MLTSWRTTLMGLIAGGLGLAQNGIAASAQGGHFSWLHALESLAVIALGAVAQDIPGVPRP